MQLIAENQRADSHPFYNQDGQDVERSLWIVQVRRGTDHFRVFLPPCWELCLFHLFNCVSSLWVTRLVANSVFSL